MAPPPQSLFLPPSSHPSPLSLLVSVRVLQRGVFIECECRPPWLRQERLTSPSRTDLCDPLSPRKVEGHSGVTRAIQGHLALCLSQAFETLSLCGGWVCLLRWVSPHPGPHKDRSCPELPHRASYHGSLSHIWTERSCRQAKLQLLSWDSTHSRTKSKQ